MERRYTSTPARPYPTARATISFSAQYFFANGCVTPFVACRNSAFWRWMSCWMPLMNVHTVGWWHWNSDCSPWCHPSTLWVLRAIPSEPATCWFQVSTGTVSCCTSSSSATTDISMFEKWRQLVHMMDSCSLRLTQKFERLLHVFRRNEIKRRNT